jgi:hypothetical protein
LEREIPGDPDSAAGPCIPVHDLPAAGFTLQNMKLWLSNDPAPIVLPTSEIEI